MFPPEDKEYFTYVTTRLDLFENPVRDKNITYEDMTSKEVERINIILTENGLFTSSFSSKKSITAKESKFTKLEPVTKEVAERISASSPANRRVKPEMITEVNKCTECKISKTSDGYFILNIDVTIAYDKIGSKKMNFTRMIRTVKCDGIAGVKKFFEKF